MKDQEVAWRSKLKLLRLLKLLVAATSLLREILFGSRQDRREPAEPEEADAADAATERSGPEGGGDSLRRQFVDKRAEEINQAGYLTHDIVQLEGGFGSQSKTLQINSAQLNLTRAEFVFLFLLAAHAHTREGLPARRRVEGGAFLSAKEILREVDALRRDEPLLGDFWESAIFNDVHQVVYELRKKITRAGANKNLIQSGPSGKGGYRLGTPPLNVTIRTSQQP